MRAIVASLIRTVDREAPLAGTASAVGFGIMRKSMTPAALMLAGLLAGCASEAGTKGTTDVDSKAAAAPASAASRPQAPADDGAAARELYAFLREKYDRNADGVVERNEYDRDDDAFARLDKDGDGRVTERDVLRPSPPPPELGGPYMFVRAFGPPEADAVGADDAVATLSKRDRNDDGGASAEELIPAVGPEGGAYLIGLLDRNADGVLNAAELRAYVAERDRDGDGRISRRERNRAGKEPAVGRFDPEVREQAPPFRLAALDGGPKVALADLRSKPVVLVFGSFT